MEGFFTKKEVHSNNVKGRKTYSCISCGLLQKCKSPKLKYSGKFKKRILNIAFAPDGFDDTRNKPFQNKYFKQLEKMYRNEGIDLWNDCANMYAVECYSKTKPTNHQIDCCRKNTLDIINKLKPDIVVVFGIDALYGVIGNRFKKDFGDINKWRGWTIPDQDLQTWICPTFSENIFKYNDPIYELILEKDIARISELSNNPKFRKYREPKIIDITGDLTPLNDIKDCNVAFDYETTGIKPHKQGHKIVCASVAFSKNKVYTFEMPTNSKKLKPFIDLMQRKSVGKIAQNMKFEDNWTNVILKTPVNNWVWDTMIATHQLDNRKSITGLKFQTYVQFGIIDYDSEVSPYLKSVENNNANGFNTIEKAMANDTLKKLVLEYCALDSIFEYRLAMLQMPKIIGKKALANDVASPENAYNLFHKGTLNIAKSERQGLRIDTDYIDNKTKRLNLKINKLEEKIKESDFYKEWRNNSKSAINLNSGKQLSDYLYGVKKIKPKKTTKSGKGSTDVEALELLNIPELDWLIQRQRLLKVRDTYLKAFDREQIDGVLHPVFNLHLARTYRSSSSNPNFQNIPKRDKVAMTTVRKSIFPRKGNMLLEVDYSGLEVSIAACYHKDPTMIKYLNDPNSDMHGDIASEIFMIKDFDKHNKYHKVLRAATKNGFVFPQFYGDYYVNCANNISGKWVGLHNKKWKKGEGILIDENTTISDHMISRGIDSIDKFINHIKRIEANFWGKRFKVYKRWKEKWYDTYLDKGEVPFKTGFTARGVMSRNDVINYPVQGAAYHCLLWGFNKITEYLEENNMQSKIVGQIHDAIVFDIYPPELEKVWNIVQKIGTKELPKTFKWINVPLSIEGEICEIDKSWADKKDFDISKYV